MPRKNSKARESHKPRKINPNKLIEPGYIVDIRYPYNGHDGISPGCLVCTAEIKKSIGSLKIRRQPNEIYISTN